MAADEFGCLKTKTVEMGDGKMVNDTKMLDGYAQDSSVDKETNKTTQYKTPKLKIGDLGDMNNQNC